MGGPAADDLRAEAVFLARRAFGVTLRPEDAGRYAAAHDALAITSDPDADRDHALLRRAMARNADIEGLEFALRLRRRRNVLTRKLHVLAFLIEADQANAPRFVSETPRPWQGRLALAGHGLRAAWKYVIGRWWLRRLAVPHA